MIKDYLDKVRLYFGLFGKNQDLPPLRIRYSPENREIMYLSRSKLETAIDSFTRSNPLSAHLNPNPKLSLEPGARRTTKADRQLIKEFLDFVESIGRVNVEENPEKGKYFLFTFHGACGTVWPYAQSDSAMRNTAWWAGSGELGGKTHTRVMAFGSLDNLRGQGNASNRSDADTPTWHPSRIDSYRELLIYIGGLVVDESKIPNFESFRINGLYDSLFRYPIDRGEYIHSNNRYIILLRVDAVADRDETGYISTVVGSPVFVLR